MTLTLVNRIVRSATPDPTPTRTATAISLVRTYLTTTSQTSTVASGLALPARARTISSSAPEHGSSSKTKTEMEQELPELPKPTGLVMQIIVRRDLLTVHNWPVGPLLAQSAHAATAVLHKYRDHQDVRRYLEGEDGRGWECMRKVVMEVADEKSLKDVVNKLDSMANPIPYHLWIEQPENTPTALALIPNKRPKALKKILDEHCVLFS
ncbi:hypothetical protein IAT40_005942 [Kwoniella sp. CBS 6097]